MEKAKHTKYVAFIMLLLATLSVTHGQKLPDEKLKKADKLELLKDFGKVLSEQYLFADTAALMGELLADRLSSGEYDQYQSARAFAAALTNDLRSNFRDRHIAIKYQPKIAKALRSGNASDGDLTEEIIQEQLAIEVYENFRIPEVKRLNGNVGYLRLDQILPPVLATGYTEKLAAAIELVADTDAIILDLRSNVGGYAEGVRLLLSYFFPPETKFMKGIKRTAQGLETDEEYTRSEVLGRSIIRQKVYVLTSSRTGSAAEAIAHVLKYSGRAKLVGESTYGAGYSFDDFPVGEKFIAQVPNTMGIHPNAVNNWESVGVKPHVITSHKEAFDKAMELALMDLLEEEKAKPARDQYGYKLKNLEWEYKRVKDMSRTFELTEDQRQLFAGQYGYRHITVEGNQLFYQRTNPNQPKRRMIPVSTDEFLIEGLDNYRIKFTRNEKSNEIEALRFYSIDRLFIDKKKS